VSNDVLSQAEIDALLASIGGDEGGENWSDEVDELVSLFDSAVARASRELDREMRLVDLSTVPPGEVEPSLAGELLVTGAVSGRGGYLIPEGTGQWLARLVGASGAEELSSETDELKEAVREAVSSLLGGLAAVLSENQGAVVAFQVGELGETAGTMDETGPVRTLVMHLQANDIDGPASIGLILPDSLTQWLREGSSNPNVGLSQSEAKGEASPSRVKPSTTGPSVVAPVEFPPLEAGTGDTSRGRIELLMDVPLNLTVELGRTTKRIGEVLALGQGSVLELDRLAGELVDILVNGKLIARGEVVVIDESFGVRISDIVSPRERLNSLR